MRSILQDLSYGLRGLRNQPAFAFMAIVTLALGIGSATTIFSAIQNILLNPFPYTDAQRVVAIQIHDTTNSRPGGRTYYQLPEFLDYKEQNHVFEDVIGGTGDDVLYNSGDGMEQFQGGYENGRRRSLQQWRRHGAVPGRLCLAKHVPVPGSPGVTRPRYIAGRREAGRATGLR